MKVIALIQAYNEALFIEQYIRHMEPLVDGMIITEGLLSPFGGLSQRSPDGTYDIIDKETKGRNHIIFARENVDTSQATTREKCEGINKNRMLKQVENKFGLEDGDVIFIGDVDEFFLPESFAMHVDLMREHPEWNFIRSEEWQYAYNFNLAFKSSHGRFMRYKKGSKFGTTNHFKHPDGFDITRRPDYVVPRVEAGFFHFCWVKHPQDVRAKVVSFNRPSFTRWFNEVYLEWPNDPKYAYYRNRQIPPYFGTGFAEGMHEKLVKFEGELPKSLEGLEVDWLPYIVSQGKDLIIR